MVVYELITVTCISLVVVSLFYFNFRMLYPSYLFVHVLLARFGDGLGSPEVPAVGESGTSRQRGFADGATESATWSR